MESMIGDMQLKAFDSSVMEATGIDSRENKSIEAPETTEELQLHMQLTYKQAIELAEEQALNVLFEGNKYELIKKQFYYDLTVLGIGAVKSSFNTSEGVVIDYVDPANLVYSHSDSPYFEDIYYVGEVKDIPINELAKQLKM